MSTFATLESEDVRDHWAHEERDFSQWLADELGTEEPSVLEDVLGLDLDVLALEKRVGSYRVDIVAETVENERTVVIENQLSSSDHDHLGKSIAYAAGLDAEVVVWIAPQFRDEHLDAIQWLNQNSREQIDFFAIRLEVWKIGDSEPALRMNPLEKPSEWKQRIQRSSGDLSPTQQLQEEYWTEFRNLIRDSDTPLRPRKPRPKHWYDNPIGKSGFHLSFNTNTTENNLYTQLIIHDDELAFEEFADDRERIEDTIGCSLNWVDPEETLSGNFRSKIQAIRDGDLTDRDSWGEYQKWMLDVGNQFHDTFHDKIQQLEHL